MAAHSYQDREGDVPKSARLRFRRMTDEDLPLMQSLLGDPAVMTHYDHPKSADECRAWIEWNKRNYARDGFGLWIVETADGEFVGDCGLTWQPIDGESLEVGYHVLPKHQGRGFASEAAKASVEFARTRGVPFVIAIVAPDNVPSARVAEKAGMTPWRRSDYGGREHVVYRIDLATDLSR